MPFPYLPGTHQPTGGVAMTVTRPPSPDNERPRRISHVAIRGIHAVRGLLLALAAVITAVTGLIVALINR
jgi:hypothetical protein